VSEENKKMTITLTLADYLCHECGFGYRRYYPQKGLLRKCMDYLGVRKYALDMIVEEMKTEMNKMKDQGLF
jgi:hypothetical protein